MNFKRITYPVLAILIIVLIASCGGSSSPAEKKWSAKFDDVLTFSSPRVADFNGDGVLDIITGAGKELKRGQYNIVAIDGSNGKVLWHQFARDDIFGCAMVYDINNDKTPDVFIGGRNAMYYCIDGKSGKKVWEFYPDLDSIPAREKGYFNFYSGLLVPDQNNDGLMDILITNGGDATKAPGDPDRPPGRVMVLNSKTGEILANMFTPDSAETYCSPLYVDLGRGQKEVVFGTGGETLPGALWAVTLADVMKSNKAGCRKILNSPDKGVIAPPSFADINGDKALDIVVALFNGTILAYDDKNAKTIWKVENTGFETYTTPALGDFDGDGTLDVFVTVGKGVFPNYASWKHIMLNGKNGANMLTESFQYKGVCGNSPVAFDYDKDGADDVLYYINKRKETTTFDWVIYSHKNNKKYALIENKGGFILYTTPIIIDLDNNKKPDFVYALIPDSLSEPDFSNISEVRGWEVQRYEFNVEQPTVSWGSYLGTNNDGLYKK